MKKFDLVCDSLKNSPNSSFFLILKYFLRKTDFKGKFAKLYFAYIQKFWSNIIMLTNENMRLNLSYMTLHLIQLWTSSMTVILCYVCTALIWTWTLESHLWYLPIFSLGWVFIYMPIIQLATHSYWLIDRSPLFIRRWS